MNSWLSDIFIFPTNAEFQGSDFTLLPIPPGAPDDYFEPPLSSSGGANYFDRERATLFVILRGADPVDIRVMPVIQVISRLQTPPLKIRAFSHEPEVVYWFCITTSHGAIAVKNWRRKFFIQSGLKHKSNHNSLAQVFLRSTSATCTCWWWRWR